MLSLKPMKKKPRTVICTTLITAAGNIPMLMELLENVLPSKKELEDFEFTQAFSAIGKKTFCLNARQIENANGDELILLAIEDITYRRKVEEGLVEAERLLSESRERLKFAVDSAGLGTWDYDPQTNELHWDKRCKQILAWYRRAILICHRFTCLFIRMTGKRLNKK